MSWSRRALVLLFVAGILPALAACGFEPMYSRKDGDDVPAEFAAIQIEPIKDRTGQLIHNQLRDSLSPRGLAAKPRYVLKVTYTETVRDTIVQQTAFASRADIALVAAYQLLSVQTRAVLSSGTATANSSFTYQSGSIGTLAGEKDARERAAGDVARQIHALLGVYFKRDAIESKRN